MTRAYQDIIEFIARGCSTEEVAGFSPSDEARERVSYLLKRKKEDALTADESSELEGYMNIEKIMSLAKAQARQYLSHE